MKFFCSLACSLAYFAFLATAQAVEKPAAHTQGTPTGKSSGPLKPGEYWWKPQLSPSGPLMVLVSVPEQTMHVYRNGVLIGRSSVSTGTAGNATPGGVFSILEKKQSHHSKKYNNAPMPNMQRLTWTGIAMHSGNLPGYPASHGCIRLPFDFSQLLFSQTAKGGTVVVGDGKTPVPHLASNPGLLLAPKDVTVTVKVLGQQRGTKIRIGKYKKRTGYKRHTGFRAALTQIEIESIGGKKRAAAKPKAVASEAAEPEPVTTETAVEDES